MFAAFRPAAAGLLLLVLTGGSVARAAAPPASARPHVDPPAAPLIRNPAASPPAAGDTPTPGSAAADTVRRRARELYNKGLLLEQQQAYSGAIVSYTNAARMDPTLRGPSFRIGRLYASRRQWDPAARAFREEMRRGPDDVAAAREYALMLVELGDTTRPVPMLEELTRRSPADPTLWRALGFTHERLNRHAAAEKALRGAVALDAKYALAWRDLGVVLAAQGRTREAREAYRRAMVADPRDVGVLVNLANLESEEGAHARALELYRTAERLDTLQGLAYQGQVRELVALGRESEAGDVWRRWLARSPYDLELRESAARHFVRQRRADVAVSIARDGVRLAPDVSGMWWLLGEMQAQAGDSLSAMSAYDDAGRRARQESDRERAKASLAALRATASEPLRARFAADSLTRVRADTTRVRGR